MSEEISTKQFLKAFERKVRALGGIEKAAIRWKLSQSFVRSVGNGSQLPGKRILKAMNLKPVKEIKYRYESIS